jgi:hypothetical protein
MWLNLYGCEAVRHKLKNDLKTQKVHFLPVFGHMSDQSQKNIENWGCPENDISLVH